MENKTIDFVWKQLYPQKIDELMEKSGAAFEMMNWVHYDNFDYEKYSKFLIEEVIKILNK